MPELFRCRVDGELLADAKRVAEDIGTDCGVLVNIMFKQLVKRRTVPFPLMSDSAEDEILSPAGRRAAMLDEMYVKSNVGSLKKPRSKRFARPWRSGLA